MMDGVGLAMGLTLLAGMATGIGSTIAFFARRTDYRFLSVMTGFSAGVMLYVSFVELFPQGLAALGTAYGERAGAWINALAFFGGIAFIGVIDSLVPSAENPHEIHGEQETAPLHDLKAPLPDFARTAGDPAAPVGSHDHRSHDPRLLRMGIFMALAIGIHNLPEGLATFLAALQSPNVGTAIAVAVALHNIPEGISVAVPIFYATGHRGRAFAWSLLSGLAEPLGAVAAYGALLFFFGGDAGIMPIQVMGIMFTAVAGIMVFISLDELLPASRAYGRGHDSIYGLLAGMAIMALSLLMMK
jgi:ZIP family zinc transporter